MPAEPPSKPATAAPSGVAQSSSAGVAAMGDERVINAPSSLTLRLLTVMFLATFVPWAAAKLACNRRDAPARAPLDLPVEVLAKQPKDAAIEIEQRIATGRYDAAAELAKGDLKAQLLAQHAACQTDPKPCEERRSQSGRVFTRAVVQRRGPLSAEVRAENTLGEARERFELRLEPEAGRWYAVSRAPFAGPLTEPLPVPPPSTGNTPVVSITSGGHPVPAHAGASKASVAPSASPAPAPAPNTPPSSAPAPSAPPAPPAPAPKH